MTAINDVMNHFKNVDPVLYSVALKVGDVKIEKGNSKDYFSSLCREIVGQQLSGKVASVIFNRFLVLSPNNKITADHILDFPDKKIRDAGMSWSKVSSLKDLAKKVKDGSINLDALNNLSNGEILRELTKVKGIGPWTVEMFLMFTLGREDVFSYGDLGLKRAMQNTYKFRKEPSRKRIESLTEKWSPYKTYACLILWKSVDG